MGCTSYQGLFEDCIKGARVEGCDQGYADAKQELEYELEEVRAKLNKILGDM